MSKRETEQYINEIWADKEELESKERTSDTEPAKHLHLSTFFEMFLEVLVAHLLHVLIYVNMRIFRIYNTHK